MIFRHGHLRQRFHLCVWHDAGGRDGVTKEIRIRGAAGSLQRAELEIVLSVMTLKNYPGTALLP